MIVGLYIDSSSESGILFSPGKSVYSVDVLPEEQDDETMTTDNAIEDEIIDDNIDDEPIQTSTSRFVPFQHTKMIYNY